MVLRNVKGSIGQETLAFSHLTRQQIFRPRTVKLYQKYSGIASLGDTRENLKKEVP
jgi:hypothetical protein